MCAQAGRMRHCPHCRRVVERIDGCSSMVCGRNYHGGGQQNGCGQGFNWEHAPRYQADIGHRPDVPAFAAAEPQRAAVKQHMVSEGVPLRCSECGDAVVGPLANCINCPSHDRCVRCQTSVPHPPNHVFRIVME
jgi:hypothetical protein